MRTAHVASRATVQSRALRPASAGLISISTPKSSYKNKIDYTEWNPFLALQFSDINKGQEHTVLHPVLFNETHAKRIINFIWNHPYLDLVIHCDAGMSRSVAVGMFAEKYFDYELKLHDIKTTLFHNSHVLATLEETVHNNDAYAKLRTAFWKKVTG